MKHDITMTVRLPFKIRKKGKLYISSCPALDVFSQGRTQKEAKKNLIEALEAFLTACIEHGTLDDVLKECGLKPYTPPARKKPLVKKADYVNIPIHLLTQTSAAKQCRA